MDKKLDLRYFLNIFGIAAVIVYILFAIRCIGYYHLDEHYQLIQFAEYKLGNTKEIPWEFNAGVRASIQPVICMMIFSCMRYVDITDHYTLALTLRIITAIFSVIAISIFVKSNIKSIPDRLKLHYLIFSYFCWFQPYLGVRFSAETWSGILCLLAISKAQTITIEKSLSALSFTGILCGLAILFRFQSIMVIAGVFAWLAFVLKLTARQLVTILIAILSVMLAGVILDSLFYGSFTISLYNYVNVNVFKGVATYFGTEPWYMIIYYILDMPFLPFGVIILSCGIIFFYTNRKSIYTWAILPFLILHMLSPHKEERFLFPIANLVPIVVIQGIGIFGSFGLRLKPAYIRILFWSIILINLTAIIVRYEKFTRRGETEIAKYMHDNFNGKKINVLTSLENNPFDPTMNFDSHYYREVNTKITDINSMWQPSINSLIKKDCINLLVLSVDDHTGRQATLRLRELNATLMLDNQTLCKDFFLKLYSRRVAGQKLRLYLLN